MAIISVYIPDNDASRVFDAIALHYGYQPTVTNQKAGQDIITWSNGNDEDLLLIAQSLGYEYETIPDPIVFPFIENAGVLGIITGQEPLTSPNPQTKTEFTNGIIRGFLIEHLKVYELEKARKEAEAAAMNATNITVDDGSTATVYNYHMVCVEPAKAQYDGLASIISPGNIFHIPLSLDGQLPATHYGLEAGITETARQQLLVLELAGGTSTGGVQTLFYVRCDPQTNIAQSTNIEGYDIVGQECNMSKLLEHLGLQEC